MRKLLPALTLLALVACSSAVAPSPSDSTSSAGRVMEGTGIMIRVEQTTTEDAQAVPHTKAVLHITGVVEKDIDLGDVQGPLLYVDPATYPVFAEQENKPETVAVFTSWFAGQGEDIWVQMYNQSLIVSSRFGDEQDVCTEPKEIANVALGKDVVVEWENLPEQTKQSSIAFCYKK